MLAAFNVLIIMFGKIKEGAYRQKAKFIEEKDEEDENKKETKKYKYVYDSNGNDDACNISADVCICR